MKRLKEYRIAFTGLSLGKHEFNFEVDQNFFDCFEYSIVKDGKLAVQVVLEKQSNMMVADFYISGYIVLECDVCLKAFHKPTTIEERLIIKYKALDMEDEEEVDEIQLLSRQDHDFSIVDFLYEQINLSVPYFVKCEDLNKEELCDPVMKELLENLSPNNQDSEGQSEQIDPRWEALNKLKRNN